MIRLTDLAGKGSFTMGGKKFEYGKVYSNPYVSAFKPVNEAEGSEDHEVSMAQNQLDSIIKHATELKQKMGEEEKQIPAWIQDHITNSENYISQAASNYHEYGDSNEGINEASDEELVKNMQKTIKDLETKLRTTKDSKEREMIKKNIAVNTGLLNWWKTRKEVVSEAGPCWKGYQQVGMKMKNGREVPNCVPKNENINEAGVPKMYVKYLAVQKKVKELEEKQKAMGAKYFAEKDPKKKAKMMPDLKKGTNQLAAYRRNLADIEEKYVTNLYSDAEYQGES
jgi:uncharacterized protein with von Willebrand factor type A (vWA) domain